MHMYILNEVQTAGKQEDLDQLDPAPGLNPWEAGKGQGWPWGF